MDPYKNIISIKFTEKFIKLSVYHEEKMIDPIECPIDEYNDDFIDDIFKQYYGNVAVLFCNHIELLRFYSRYPDSILSCLCSSPSCQIATYDMNSMYVACGLSSIPKCVPTRTISDFRFMLNKH